MIDKEFLQNRLIDLDKQKKNALATYHAVLGSIQECEYYFQMVLKQAETENSSNEVNNDA